MTILFDTIYFIAALFYLPSLILKGKHKAGFSQRLGFYDQDLLKRIKNERFPVWLHAVSVGEMKAAAPLIRMLKNKYPKIKLIISTITPAGNKVACDIADETDIVIYFPFDLSFIVKKVFALFKPKLLLIMETELWPNVISNAGKNNIKTVILNGRISDKALPRYRKAAFLFKPIVAKIDQFLMQTEDDCDRIISIGARKESVHVVGNIKFDQLSVAGENPALDLGLPKGQKIIIAGSTHNDEEQQIAEAFKKLKKKHKNISLLIAPRHIERVAQIEEVLNRQGLSCVLISQVIAKQRQAKTDDVLVLDLMGVLADYYRLAEIVFVGGSLVKHGGQNPIEPATIGKPIVFGQYMFNFAEIVKQLLAKNAAICVKDKDALLEALDILLTDKEKKVNLIKQAKAVIEENKGTVKRISDFLDKMDIDLK